MSVMLYPCILCVALLMLLFVLCCVFDGVCELFGETIPNVFGCGCYFVVSCHLQHSICFYSLFLY